MYAIKNVQLVTPTGILQQQAVVCDTKIIAIIQEDQLDPSVAWIDGGGCYLVPGFIDLHLHGCAGYDVMDEDPLALTEIAKNIVRTGVTAFLPTTMTMEFSKIIQALERIRRFNNAPDLARVLGCHLEGPFLSSAYKGAQDEQYFRDPDFELIRPYSDLIRIITLAPEKPGSSDFIIECRKQGIIASIGHSNATFEVAKAAIASGVTYITHTFNAMSPLHHRNPGVVAAALLDDTVTCELIADNFHVHPEVQKLLAKVKGSDRLVLITDAMEACLLGDGNYHLGGQPVVVKNNQARLTNGSIAGSVLTMNRALKNMAKNSGLPLWEVVRMTSFNAARLLGLATKGAIEVGKDADMVLLDKDFEVVMTLIAGQPVYSRE
ncbi:MAG TPA: N-acetylglucosamine-6-phosphate deacetylase [Bacillota bacterium]